MPRTEPRMRVAMSQMLLGVVDRLAPAERTAIRSRLRGDTLHAVEDNLALTFIPMAFHMELSDALRDVVGPARNVDVWAKAMHAAWDRPLLRGFVGTVTSLFGLEPQSLLKQTGRVHEHVTKDIAHVHYEAGPKEGSGSISLTGFPSRQFRFICYVEGMQGCIESIFALTRTSGEVVPTRVDEARGEVDYAIHWASP